MDPWSLGEGVSVRPLRLEDAPVVAALIADNRAHLDRWLRWSAAVRTVADVEAMIAAAQARLASADGFHCGIWEGESLAGGVVCWYINRANRNAEIGYWLGEASLGRGLATRAARRAVAYLFDIERLHRVEMLCGVGNLRSRAVPERLGFREEGIRRESHWITDRFVDHAVYGILDREWPSG